MTAFAKASHIKAALRADVTIRSYNSRHLDFSLHLPEACLSFEEDIKKRVGLHHCRGRIEVRMTLVDDSPDPDLFEVDQIRARSYYTALKTLQESVGLSSEIKLETLVSARNIITPAPREFDSQLLGEVVLAAVEKAAVELDRMRRQEGENLRDDLSKRLDYIETHMAGIEKEAVTVPMTYKERLEERLAKLTGEAQGIDPMRLAQEVAILADKSDISEEIVRIHSHIKLFRDVMGSEESQGRKLNFLIQEFNREFNTIGSKSGNAVLSHMAVDLKSELEKIREQVQNIE